MVHCMEILGHHSHRVAIDHLSDSKNPEHRGPLEAVTLIQTVNVLQNLANTVHSHNPRMANHPHDKGAGNGSMRGLLMLLNAFLSSLQLVIFLRVKAAAEVLCLSALLLSSLTSCLPKVVNVWSVDLKLGSSEGDSLFQREQLLAN